MLRLSCIFLSPFLGPAFRVVGGGVLWGDKKEGDHSPTFVIEGGFSEGSPLRQTSIISREAGGIFERLEESAGSPESTSGIRCRKISPLRANTTWSAGSGGT